MEHRIFGMAVARVYPAYQAKVEKKGRSKAELDAVIFWLTGHDAASLARVLQPGRWLHEGGASATDSLSRCLFGCSCRPHAGGHHAGACIHHERYTRRPPFPLIGRLNRRLSHFRDRALR